MKHATKTADDDSSSDLLKKDERINRTNEREYPFNDRSRLREKEKDDKVGNYRCNNTYCFDPS